MKGFLYVMLGEFNDFPGDFRGGHLRAHEFGHTLGLVDLYDPQAAGLGFFSLVALGNYLRTRRTGARLASSEALGLGRASTSASMRPMWRRRRVATCSRP